MYKLFSIFLFQCMLLSSVLANEKALDSLKKSLEIENQADTSKIDILVDIANLLNSDNTEKEKHLLEAIQIAEKTNDLRRLVIPILNITRYYLNNGNFDLAYQKALYSIDVGKKIENRTFLIEGYNNLALVYTKQNKSVEALEVYLEGYEYIKNEAPSLDKAILSYNIGFAYYNQENYTEAENWYQKVELICEAIQLDYGLVRAYGALLSLYGKTKEFDKGDQYEKKVLSFIDSIDNSRSKAAVFNNLAIYAADKNNFEKIIEYGKKAEAIYQDLNMKNELISIDDKLFRAFKQKSEFEKALEYAEKKMELADSIYTEKQLEAITELETKYKTEKIQQEKDLETLRAEKNRKLFFISTLAAISTLLVALFLIYQIQLRKRAEIAEVKLADTQEKLMLERKFNNAEMKALRAQMNPHFLFNAFNSIQEYIIMNNRELASDYLGKFADLMRIYLDHSRSKRIALEDEIAATNLYLELEKIRFENELNYNIQLDENIDASAISIPPMLIQPFIENSLKHGLAHKKENKKISIDFKIENSCLVCTIEDNGVGRKMSEKINQTKSKTHNSFATSATRNRIDLLNVGMEKEIELKIKDLKDSEGKAQGTRVELSIPLKNNNI